MRRVESNLWKMKVVRVLYWAHLFAAVLVPFFRDWGGLDYTHIMFLNAWFWFCNFLLEVPTGTVADFFGRKISIVAGCFVAAAAVLVYASMPVYSMFLLGELLFAVSMTLLSGADDALIYDTLVHLGREEESKVVYARLESFKLGGIVAGALMGAPIAAALGLRAPMLLQAIPFVLSGLVAMTLVEPGGKPERPERGAYFQMLFAGVRYFRSHAALRVLAYDMVGTGTVAWLIIWFYQPQLERAGVGIFFFGFVQAAMCLSQILVLNNIQTLERWVGSKRRWLFLSALVPAVTYLVLWASTSAAIVVPAVVLTACFGLSRQPLFISYMNQYIPSETRATVLSTISMFRTIIVASVNPIAGWLADWSMPKTMLILAASALVLALVSRVREEHLG